MMRLFRFGAVAATALGWFLPAVWTLPIVGCAAAEQQASNDLRYVDAAQDLDVRDLAAGDAAFAGDLGSADLGPSGDMGTALVCAGEKYDVNANVADACEATDSPLGNHSQATSVQLGTFNCDDSASSQNVTGTLLADARTHSPSVSGLDSASGSAPDWFQIIATGGLCSNNLNLHLQVTGASKPACYKLTALTNVSPYTCQSSAAGACDISNGQGSYSDNTNIFINVTKTCAGNDKASYTITGHL